MAYVREHGNQLAIVHGERDPETGKVQQRVLFTIYSKAEALEIVGHGDSQNAYRFQALLGDQYPNVKFNWKKILKSISEKQDVLPDLHEYKITRLQNRFRTDLRAFVKQLVLADPQDLFAAATLIREHQYELEFLTELIQWRLKTREQEESQWNQDNPFYWRFALRGNSVPPDTEEQAVAYFDRGEHEKAEAVFRLLVECFEDYAEGYNYMGLIALEQFNLDEAIVHFEKTVELGRPLFPKRIARDMYWGHLSTRPYMRGMRNLAQTLNQAGRYEEALELWNRMDNEWGEDDYSIVQKSVTQLNTQQWERAADLALLHQEIYPSQSFIAAFAFFEQGNPNAAIAAFIHGLLNRPLAAQMLFGKRSSNPPKDFMGVEDHNDGVALGRSLGGYWSRQSRASKRFFRNLFNDARIVSLLSEIKELNAKMEKERQAGKREAFDRIHAMQRPEFAQQEADKLAELLSENS